MDDDRVGNAIRAIRQRKRWRQRDLGTKAGVSQTVVARVERGALANIPLGTLRRVAQAMDARVVVLIRWQGGDLDRLVSARHAAMHEEMARLFATLRGWIAEPEVSFSVYGERGVVDILAWHEPSRSLMVIELKTEFVDLNEMLATLDRKRRLAASIALDRGRDVRSVSSWVVVADSRTNRRVLARHSVAVRAKLPVDGRTIRSWLRRPYGRVDALSFLSSSHRENLRIGLAPVRRVTRLSPRFGTRGTSVGSGDQDGPAADTSVGLGPGTSP